MDSNLDQQIIGICFCIFNEDIKIPVIMKNSGVDQFKFRIQFSSSAGFRPPAMRKEIPAADTYTTSSCTSGWAYYQGSSTAPYNLQRDCLRCRSDPKIRSLRIGSFLFQRATEIHNNCLSSLIPPIPSSPHRYALLRAASCEMYSHALPCAL